MEKIVKEGNLRTPKINLDPDNGLIELSGRSTPENTEIIYRPLIEWMENYVNNPHDFTTINLQFEYFNSTSAKYLIRLLEFANVLKDNNKQFVINWYYEDEELLEYGEDFQDVLELQFNYIPVEEPE